MINDILKNLIVNYVVKKLVARFVVALPFLGLPIINGLVVMVVSFFASRLIDEASRFVNFKLIDFETEAEREKFEIATEKFDSEIQKEGITDAEVLAAREEYQKSLSSLVSFRDKLH